MAAAKRPTTEQRLQRSVWIATVTFLALFVGMSAALRPWAVPLSVAFARTDATALLPVAPQHVFGGACGHAAPQATARR